MTTKVRAGQLYTFRPCGWDIAMPQHYTARPGQRVRVIQLPSAPRPGTMGQAHIEDLDGDFLGMVSVHSLVKE